MNELSRSPYWEVKNLEPESVDRGHISWNLKFCL